MTTVRTAAPGEVWDRPVTEMRKGDRWVTCDAQTLLLEDPELTADGLVRIRGRIVTAVNREDVGYTGSWVTPASTTVDYIRTPR